MMTTPLEDTTVEGELGSEVRHNILLCWVCSNGNQISDPPVELTDRLVTTICDRFVRYRITTVWCEECVTIRNGGVFADECAMCGRQVSGSDL